MQALHEKNKLEQAFPFRLFISTDLEFPPHWHEEIEIIYVIEGNQRMVVNNKIYFLEQGDILFLGNGDVHCFTPQRGYGRILIIQFSMSLLGNYAVSLRNKKLTMLLSPYDNKQDAIVSEDTYYEIKRQLFSMKDEVSNKMEGYQLALKSRIFDIIVKLLRSIPMGTFSYREKSKQMERLERLQVIFNYVEEFFDREITLDEIARVANLSVYYFTRFFKESTGMTFGKYLNGFRVSKAEWYLISSGDTVLQIALKSGFNNLKSFNRVFRGLKGCSPLQFRKLAREN